MQPWVTCAIFPVIGLFDAGVVIDATVLSALPTVMPLCSMIGLVLGKSAAISLASLAGISFTMALFISGLAFGGLQFQREAKLAILIGPLLAAAVGIAILLTKKATQVPVST